MSEDMIVRNCSPTLAGIKTGNLFGCRYESERILRGQLRRLNRRLLPKGVRVVPLRLRNGIALIYLYRPAKLREDLNDAEAVRILRDLGYGDWDQPERYVVRLAQRLREQGDFPHEIGLFLGYPPEDVRGFIENNAQGFKCAGCWKVYGDEERAKELFAKYRKCTDCYLRQLTHGNTIEQLTVAV